MRFRWIGLILASLCAPAAGCGEDAASATCGNGVLETGEFCDDGNSTSGDGCASDCLIERGPDADVGNVADADPNQPDADPNAPDANPIIPDASTAAVVINEILPNPAGNDDAEFVEVLGPPNTSLSNLTVITVDGETIGVINAVIPMGTTDANGFFANVPGDLGIQNGTETFLLVDGFVGAINDDIDANDDGTIDALTGTILDAVAVLDADGGVTFAGTAVLPLNHPPLAGQCDAASRIPDGVDTDQPGDWVQGDPTGNVAGAADVTPGAANALIP